MNPPNLKQMRAFWDSCPKGDYACADCGKVGSQVYVQPQHPFYAQDLPPPVDGRPPALCTDCIAQRNRNYREKRKAQLTQAPRCEVKTCNKRGNWNVARVGLCGRHKTKAIRGHAKAAYGYGPFGLFSSDWYDRGDVLRWANGEKIA